jgi:hypothetical protein
MASASYASETARLECNRSIKRSGGPLLLSIEMRSGGTIKIEASTFQSAPASTLILISPRRPGFGKRGVSQETSVPTERRI